MRSTQRVPCHTWLRVANGSSEHRFRTLDISHGGLYFELDRPIEVGTVVDLTFTLPDSGDDPIQAVGRIAWSNQNGVGVKFVRIEPQDLRTIVEYVNRVARVLYSPL
ncbi:MAG: PilZ domain-containing protein [Myxococcales bacterium]|nr:PilZ domain-containing protein [Myxococcales bacterium]